MQATSCRAVLNLVHWFIWKELALMRNFWKDSMNRLNDEIQGVILLVPTTILPGRDVLTLTAIIIPSLVQQDTL
jgi:hypothetical protein